MRNQKLLAGLELLRKAEEVLCERDGPLRDRLLAAAPWFLSALAYRTHWPWPLGARARQIGDRLAAGGSVRAAVVRMDEDAVPEVAGEIVVLIEDLVNESTELASPAASQTANSGRRFGSSGLFGSSLSLGKS